MADAFTYQRQARNRATGIVLFGMWGALLAAWVFFHAAPLVVGVLGLCTLPALWDLVINPSAGLKLSDHTLSWHSGNRTGQVALAEIDRIRVDTRLDFSVRATVILRSGRKIRLPFEATPPHHSFDAALSARSVKTERHHFSLRQ